MYHNRGDVYMVLYPFDEGQFEKLRPAIILETQDNKSIVIKVTTHDEREHDDGDLEIIHWQEAGLDRPSVARCSDFVPLDHEKTINFIGKLHEEDLLNVLEKMYRNNT
jgi:mRNA interferase MazF